MDASGSAKKAAAKEEALPSSSPTATVLPTLFEVEELFRRMIDSCTTASGEIPTPNKASPTTGRSEAVSWETSKRGHESSHHAANAVRAFTRTPRQ